MVRMYSGASGLGSIFLRSLRMNAMMLLSSSKIIAFPHSLVNLLLGEHFPAVARQKEQNIELLWRQGKFRIRPGYTRRCLGSMESAPQRDGAVRPGLRLSRLPAPASGNRRCRPADPPTPAGVLLLPPCVGAAVRSVLRKPLCQGGIQRDKTDVFSSSLIPPFSEQFTVPAKIPGLWPA